MNRSHVRRLLSVTAVAALALAALGAAPVAARTPTWAITPVRLPAVVKAGNDAGYFVTVANNGTSTINAARFTATPLATPDASPTYFSGLTWSSGGPETSCTSTGKLVCELGTMVAGASFTFTVAYNVPGATSNKFDVLFFLEAGTGNVGGKNNSRGDKLEVTSSTTLSSSQNFDGGFVTSDFQYATTGTLGRNNKQTSQVDLTDDLLTVNVEDGVTGPTCEIAACAHVIGDWTDLSVPGNQDYIKVTLMIWGGSVPGGVGAGDIYLLHSNGSGGFDAIGDTDDEICADANTAPASGECVLVTKIGSNYKLVAWLAHNGTLRGTW